MARAAAGQGATRPIASHNARMHLVLAFASPLSSAVRLAAFGEGARWEAPHLRAWLSQAAAPQTVVSGDEWSLSAPHERVLALLCGGPQAADPLADPVADPVADGLVPLAAWLAQSARLPGADEPGWALLTPSHWRLGTEQLSLLDPAALELDEAASRQLHAAVGELFLSEGFAWHWLSPTQWLCRHPSLADCPTASLDRVIGRNVDRWLTADPRARRLRRLQNEAQMLLHAHPLNADREARGALAVNSLWCSGTGVAPAAPPDPTGVLVSTELRGPALADDAQAWLEAWATWDRSVFAPWAARHGQNPAASLTLCGERRALRWTPAEPAAARGQPSNTNGWRGWLQRLAGWPARRAGPPAQGWTDWMEPL